MDKQTFLELLQKEMTNSICDAKAESQLVIALNNGLTFEDIMVCCDSLFFREYSKDVIFTELKEDPAKLPLLLLHLTRSGLYDHLPEGLFFQPSQSLPRVTTATEMAYDYRINKQKESELRRFFQPFEIDFFLQRIQLEAEETRLLEGLKTGIVKDYFKLFWELPDSIPPELLVPLIFLLPYANRIAGDLSYTAQSLEHLLQERVEIKKSTPLPTMASSLSPQLSGSWKLGTDLVCGEEFMEDYPVLEFCIGPLENSLTHDYLDGGKRFTLLQTFYRYFLPMEVDVHTQIVVNAGNMTMPLENEMEPVLGYSCFLWSIKDERNKSKETYQQS